MLDGMGYGGKLKERLLARELRAQSWTLQDIATELGVSKASVSVWVRDVEFVPNPRRQSHWTRDHPHPMHVAKLEEIERYRQDGVARIGRLSEREFFVLGLALYAGEGSKTQHSVSFANSDPRMIYVFVCWLRHFSTSMSRSCASSCTSTRAWTSTRRSSIGPNSPGSRHLNSTSPIEPSPIRRGGGPST